MKEATVKNNKTKSWFFQKINKIANLQPDSARKKKRERNKINKIRNEKGEFIADNAEIKEL